MVARILPSLILLEGRLLRLMGSEAPWGDVGVQVHCLLVRPATCDAMPPVSRQHHVPPGCSGLQALLSDFDLERLQA